MIRVIFSLITCLIFASDAFAVRLMDGEEVGLMFGYVAACVKQAGINPPATQEDKMMGKKYGLWLVNNGANAIRVFDDIKANTGIGMAAAVRSNYSNCKNALLEMIGFYQFFKLRGTSYYPALEKYTTK